MELASCRVKGGGIGCRRFRQVGGVLIGGGLIGDGRRCGRVVRGGRRCGRVVRGGRRCGRVVSRRKRRGRVTDESRSGKENCGENRSLVSLACSILARRALERLRRPRHCRRLRLRLRLRPPPPLRSATRRRCARCSWHAAAPCSASILRRLLTRAIAPRAAPCILHEARIAARSPRRCAFALAFAWSLVAVLERCDPSAACSLKRASVLRNTLERPMAQMGIGLMGIGLEEERDSSSPRDLSPRDLSPRGLSAGGSSSPRDL